MSQHNSKTALIAFLARLEVNNLPADKRNQIVSITNHLSAKHIFIPSTPKGEEEIQGFIKLFFQTYPALTTPKNILELERHLGHIFSDSLSPNQRPHKHT